MLLPQRPYIPIGPLKDAIAYPSKPRFSRRDQMQEALRDVGLPAFAERLEENDNWQMRLSGGEQQRLAVARALLAKPDWLFLDEATASLDEDERERALPHDRPRAARCDDRLHRPSLDLEGVPQAPDRAERRTRVSRRR